MVAYHLLIAYIFASSISSFPWKILSPKKCTSCWPNSHYFCLIYSLLSINTWRTFFNLSTCSSKVFQYMTISSKYTTINLSQVEKKIFFIYIQKVVGALVKTKGITNRSYALNIIMWTIFFSSLPQCETSSNLYEDPPWWNTWYVKIHLISNKQDMVLIFYRYLVKRSIVYALPQWPIFIFLKQDWSLLGDLCGWMWLASTSCFLRFSNSGASMRKGACVGGLVLTSN